MRIVATCVLSFLLLAAGSSQAQQQERCAVSLGDIHLSIEPSTGKVVSFTWKGSEFLLQRNREAVYYGATLWPDPQSHWWPIDPALDGEPYHVLAATSSSVHIRSKKGKSLQFDKTFSITADTAIAITYVIRNVSHQVQKVGPWELIRTTGGVTFFPYADSPAKDQSNLRNVHIKDGFTWFELLPEKSNDHEKLFTGGSDGWLAHVKDTLLFVKTYDDVAPEHIAPGQGEVEVYVNPDATYVELETHGVYSTLRPGESLQYHVRWYLRSFPARSISRENWPEYVRTFLARRPLAIESR
jgi:hypothetical protein